jgi:hypothetical protein
MKRKFKVFAWITMFHHVYVCINLALYTLKIMKREWDAPFMHFCEVQTVNYGKNSTYECVSKSFRTESIRK